VRVGRGPRTRRTGGEAQGGQVRAPAGREGRTAVPRVADDGAGMGPDELPRLFHLFRRA
jgi:signal transduction histidine kinase